MCAASKTPLWSSVLSEGQASFTLATMDNSPSWLAPAFDYISSWLEYQMRITEQPGCAVAIALQGKIVFEKACGHADLAHSTALTPRHRFRVGSQSKSFTAAAVMKLREHMRLRLDDTVGHYVPGLHPQISTVTISQLLSHTAGISRDGTDSGYWVDRHPFPDAARMDRELALPPVIESNTRLKYSNLGFALSRSRDRDDHGRAIQCVGSA